MDKPKIEVVQNFCPTCGEATFSRKGKVMASGVKKFTRQICKAGCGYVGPTVLEDGTTVGQLPINAKE